MIFIVFGVDFSNDVNWQLYGKGEIKYVFMYKFIPWKIKYCHTCLTV